MTSKKILPRITFIPAYKASTEDQIKQWRKSSNNEEERLITVEPGGIRAEEFHSVN